MGSVTSFSLGDHFNTFVAAQVKEDRYDNASDVMRAAGWLSPIPFRLPRTFLPSNRGPYRSRPHRA
jgi:hypothetical protein